MSSSPLSLAAVAAVLVPEADRDLVHLVVLLEPHEDALVA